MSFGEYELESGEAYQDLNIGGNRPSSKTLVTNIDQHCMAYDEENKCIKKRLLMKKNHSTVIQRPRSTSMSLMMGDYSSSTNSVLDKDQAKLFKELQCLVMNSTNYIKQLPPVDMEQVRAKKICLPFTSEHKKRMMIFDLDETLVHRIGPNDKNQTGDINLTIISECDHRPYNLGVNIRPYAQKCLREANKFFEVAVFTAGTPNYADPIIDYLDPNHELIQHRLYRDSCIEVDHDEVTKLYIKDLRILENRELKDLFIVDNAVISFAYQIDNGIPITSFTEDRTDIEFLHLIHQMECLANVDDCRTFIRSSFKISEILKTNLESYAHLYNLSETEEDDCFDQFFKASETWHSSKTLSAVSKLHKSKSFKKKNRRRSLKKSKQQKYADSGCLTKSAKLPSLTCHNMTPSQEDKPKIFQDLKLNEVEEPQTCIVSKGRCKVNYDNSIELFSSTKFSSIFTNSDVLDEKQVEAKDNDSISSDEDLRMKLEDL